MSTIWSHAQQINAVPDYVFRNQMSVGRNAVTDTAAYFSIGPRYGATRGMMPPMVVDTASFSANKRNGLLIFSVQKNKFLYWDSVGVKWAEMAGTGGTAISSGDTAAMLLPYVRHAGYGLTKSGQSLLVDTLNIATRAWRQKGLDSLAALEVSGSGTTNYIPKFTAASTIGNSSMQTDANGNIAIGVTPSAWNLGVKTLQINNASIQTQSTLPSLTYYTSNGFYDAATNFKYISSDFASQYYQFQGQHVWSRAPSGTAGNTISFTQAMTLNSASELLVNTTSDAGDYKLQVSGNMYNTGDAFIGATSGRLGIGRAPTADIDVYKNAGVTTEIVNNNNGSNLAYNADIWTMNITGRRNSSISQANARIKVTYNGDGTTRKGRMAIGVAESSGYGNANVVFTTTPGNRKVSIFGYSTEAYTDTTFSLTSNYVLHGYLMVNGYSIETVPVASFDIDGNASTVMHSSGNWSFGSTTDSGGYRVRVTGDMLVTSSITTGAPTDGTAAPWRLGSYNATAPTATGYVEVLVNGVKYKLLAATY